MKNKSLITIVAVSVALFIGLVFVVYKIALKNDNEFYANGYVSVTDMDLSDKVYFKAGTVYKKGYNNEIVFKDSSNNKSEVSKYSFVYYEGKSISYLNDGVLMALDELDSDYVPYYNIKSNYILSYENGHYVIKTKTKDISLDNFIGRISDEKYIVAGNNLKLKLGSSDELINNYYFEINFVEGNQIKIDNDKINIKTIADDSYIYVGNDVIIDLNNRIIKYKGDLKLNLSEITINSDENIDILYDSGKNIEIDDGNGGNGNGEGNGNGNGNNNNNYEPEKVVEYKNVPYVELISSNVSASRIRLDFRVIDTFKLITGDVTIRYMNLATKEVGESYCANYTDLCVFDAQNLVSNNKYLVTILASYVRNGVVHNDFIMFQRTFQTSEISLGLEREYLSSNSIAYRIKMNNESLFDSATLNLYDNSGNLVDSVKFNNTRQDQIVNFDGLNSNSTYTARIEDLVIGNVTFKSATVASSMNKTLKFNPMKDAPIINSPSASSNKKDYTFSFDVGIGEDKDNSIKEVTYSIYDSETNELVKTIKRENTTPFTIDVGEEFSNDKKYVYQATLKINDNEKVVYQKTLVSNEFSLSSKVSPYATFTRGEVTANTLSGSFKIFDADNTIDKLQNPYLEYVDSEGVKGAPVQLEYIDCGEEESASTKCLNVYLEGLTSDNVYTLSLYSYVDLKDDPEKENYIEPGFMQVGIVQVTTAEADIVYTTWRPKEIDIEELQNKVFEIDLQFSIDTEQTSELVVENMTSFDMLLYEGSEENEVLLKTIHIGAGSSIKNEYFDNAKTLTLSTFGYTLNDLITRHMIDNSDISQRYTIKLTNGKSGTDYVDFRKASYVFDIDPTLLEITNDNASVRVNLIKNRDAGDLADPSLDNDTVVAMEIIPYFENKAYVTSIDYVIYDLNDDSKTYSFSHDDIKFNTDDDEIPTEKILIYGSTSEEFLKRGHSYAVTYTLSLDLNGDGVTDLIYPLSVDITKPAPVRSERVDIPKQVPKFILLPWTSSSNSVTYKYDYTDIDNVLGESPDVYYEINEERFTGDRENAICAKSDVVNPNYNYSFNCVQLNGLKDKDIYKIFFEGKLYEDPNAVDEKFDVNDFEFESIMSPSEINSKISFELSSKYNNLAVLSISDGTDDGYYINRIANYNLIVKTQDGSKSFIINNVNDGTSYSNGSSLSFNSNNSITYKEGSTTIKANINSEPNLGSVAYVSYCDGVSGEKCIFLDYAKLYNSNTFGSYFQPLKNQDLIIEVEITYDTGKIGYYANATKRYAFQVKTTEDLVIDGTKINDYYYIVTTNYVVNGSHYNLGALSGVYTYNPQLGGFVADSAGGNSQEEYNTSGRRGEINITNGIYNGQTLNMNYYIHASGVIVNINGYEHPILAKELETTKVAGNVPFKYTRVSPTIGVAISAPTINGIRLRLQTYGYASGDVDFEDGKQYLYLEVYQKNNNLVQTLKLNKDELISQTGKIHNKQFVINNPVQSGYAEFKYNITRVEINGNQTNDYSYDYINGVITFKDQVNIGNSYIEVTDDMDILVTYNIAIYGLDINTDYYYMAYMMINNTKTYLIDSASKTYENAHKEFRTMSTNDPSVKINDVRLSVDSLEDYATRYLITNFTIGNDQSSEIIGFEDFVYKISYNNEELTIDTTNACLDRMSGYFATLDKSCIINTFYYSLYSYLDISNGHVTKGGEPFKFIFGTDYNIEILAKVKTTTGYNYYLLYKNDLPVQELNEPTVEVTKRSMFTNDQNALSFVISFNDPDRVLTGFDYVETSGDGISVQNGNYLAYLAKNLRRTRDSELKTYAVEGAGVTSITYTKGILPADINSLQNDTDYYLIMRYSTDTNNLNGTGVNDVELRFPIYTLDESKVALGKVAYFASNENNKGITELTFSYATNIMEDTEIENQEAYVAGMVYDISIFGNNTISEGTVFFVDVGDPSKQYININYVKNNGVSSDLGENYYQIILNHDEYPSSGAHYVINIQLYLGGNVASAYDTEAKCRYTDGVENSNYWDSNNNKCYILSSLEHQYDAQFKGATTGGQQ